MGLFSPEELEITHDGSKYIIFVRNSDANLKFVQDLLSNYGIYYDKALSDADIVSALEEYIKDLKESNSQKYKQVIESITSDLERVISDPKEMQKRIWNDRQNNS